MRRIIFVGMSILCSAILCSLAFINPYNYAWCVFIFLLPLFFISKKRSLSFNGGFLWGLIFYLIFLYGLFALIIERGQGVIRFIALLLLLIYAAFTSGIWFWGTHNLQQRLPKGCEIGIWVVSTWLYWIFIIYRFYFIFGQGQGNQLQNLVVPLAAFPGLLYWLPYIGMPLFLLLIVSINGLIYTAFFKKSIPSSFLLFSITIFFIGGVVLHKTSDCPIADWVKTLGCAVCSRAYNDPYCQAEYIAQLIEQSKKNNPHIKTIIMPESTFAFPLNSMTRCVSLWSEAPQLILGSHKKEGELLYNTLYFCSQGKIEASYNKEQAMFFTERIPSGWSSCTNLFLKDCDPFSNGINSNKEIKLEQGITLIPLICSELFMPTNCFFKDQILICLINDSWFSHQYISYLMVLYATMIAMKYRVTLVYCSYHYGAVLLPQGASFDLPITRG